MKIPFIPVLFKAWQGENKRVRSIFALALFFFIAAIAAITLGEMDILGQGWSRTLAILLFAFTAAFLTAVHTFQNFADQQLREKEAAAVEEPNAAPNAAQNAAQAET
ncbi:hypothetical protein [Undibacterium sp. TJN19]|uniref:hypothetical protein n=1 Tax=Undibacterium sp. TJN19 TaxID=3413055 RepID=UPI003BF3554E